MTTTKTQTDLAAIVGNLDSSIEEIDSKITGHSAKLGELQQELASIGRNKMNYAVDIEQTSLAAGRLQMAVTQATTDARLAQGTSVEAQKQQELAAVQEQLARAEAQLSTLQASFSHDSKAEQETTQTILSVQNTIAALVAEKQDAVASRERWDREQCEHIKSLGTEALGEVRAEIDRLQAALKEAYTTYDQVLHQLARDLSPWERTCLDVLAEYGRWDDNPPAVIVAQAQLAEAKEALAQAVRTRAQSGDASLNTTVVGYQQQVLNLVAHIEQLRAQHRQDAAMALLRQLRQPAPVAPTDLAQAQALHAQAQVEVVVAEPVPERETHVLTSGQHSLAQGVIGAVAKPQPSLLNPTVRKEQ